MWSKKPLSFTPKHLGNFLKNREQGKIFTSQTKYRIKIMILDDSNTRIVIIVLGEKNFKVLSKFAKHNF